LIKDVDRMQTTLENCAVFVTELQLLMTNEFLKMVSDVVASGTKDILIVCDEVHQDVVKFAVMNMAQGKLNMCIVKKPMQREYVEDISAVVGATAMTQNKGMVHPKFEYCGKAQKVVVKEKNTTIFFDESNKTTVDNYVSSLKKNLDALDEFDEVNRIKIGERIARLTGGIFMVNVGAKTEASMKHLRDKVDDAVNSLKKVWKSKDDGIVLGGGMALYNAGTKLLLGGSLNDGEKIVYETALTNLFQMLSNGGEDDQIIQKIIDNGGGYNALTMEYEPDMFKAGIVDATKVICTSFLNSCDFGADFVKYEIVVTPLPQLDVERPRVV
jgi:chaperonin GroEL